MEGIPTMLTDKQQPRLRAISRACVPTHRTGLTRVMGINLDGHTRLPESLVGNHGMHLSKGPLGRDGIGLPLLLAGLFPLPSFRSVSDIGQVLQANERVRMCARNPFTHDMVGVSFQPSLPSTDNHESPRRGTGAFLLKTLSQSCVMVGFGNDPFPGMKRLLAHGGSRYSKIADTHVYPDDRYMRGTRWLCYFYLQGDKQIELFARLVVPQFGSSDMRAMLKKAHMLLIARIREHHTTLQSQDAD